MDVVDHRVALSTAEPASKEFHNARIGIHSCENFAILIEPYP